jgi:hypothetical protein
MTSTNLKKKTLKKRMTKMKSSVLWDHETNKVTETYTHPTLDPQSTGCTWAHADSNGF